MTDSKDTNGGEWSSAEGAGVEVVVKFDPATVESWRVSGVAPPHLLEIGDEVADRGFSLEPQHPDGSTPELRAWYRVVPPDADSATIDVGAADRLVDTLLASPAVVAAFAKPPATPPG